MPQVGAIVGHFVYHSGDVRDLGVVSLKTLVQGRPEQIRRCLERRCGPFATPKHGGCVVTKGGGSRFADVKRLGENILMRNDSSQFQVGVRDGPSRVRERNEFALNCQREWLAPKDGSMLWGNRSEGDGGG